MAHTHTAEPQTQTRWRTPELLIHEPGHSPRRVRLASDRPCVVGRSRGCQITLRDRRVSRRHLQVHMHDDTLIATDLGSRAGTYHNGRRMPPNQAVSLEDADELRLGQTKIQIIWYARRLARFADEAALPEQTVVPAPAPAPAAVPPGREVGPREDPPAASATRNQSHEGGGPPAPQTPVRRDAPARPPTPRWVWACWYAAAALLVLAAAMVVFAAR